MDNNWRRLAMGFNGQVWDVALQKKNRIIWVVMPEYPKKRYYSVPELKTFLQKSEVKPWIANNGKNGEKIIKR